LCPQPAFSRPEPPKKAAAAKIGRPTSAPMQRGTFVAEFWLNLQSLYEPHIAQKKVGKSIKALPQLKRTERVPA
jgi:hypothetical protein